MQRSKINLSNYALAVRHIHTSLKSHRLKDNNVTHKLERCNFRWGWCAPVFSIFSCSEHVLAALFYNFGKFAFANSTSLTTNWIHCNISSKIRVYTRIRILASEGIQLDVMTIYPSLMFCRCSISNVSKTDSTIFIFILNALDI